MHQVEAGWVHREGPRVRLLVAGYAVGLLMAGHAISLVGERNPAVSFEPVQIVVHRFERGVGARHARCGHALNGRRVAGGARRGGGSFLSMAGHAGIHRRHGGLSHTTLMASLTLDVLMFLVRKSQLCLRARKYERPRRDFLPLRGFLSGNGGFGHSGMTA